MARRVRTDLPPRLPQRTEFAPIHHAHAVTHHARRVMIEPPLRAYEVGADEAGAGQPPVVHQWLGDTPHRCVSVVERECGDRTPEPFARSEKFDGAVEADDSVMAPQEIELPLEHVGRDCHPIAAKISHAVKGEHAHRMMAECRTNEVTQRAPNAEPRECDCELRESEGIVDAGPKPSRRPALPEREPLADCRDAVRPGDTVLR